jgi:hypothetical protein
MSDLSPQKQVAIGLITGVAVFFGMRAIFSSATNMTPQATYNTARNGFISGCKKGFTGELAAQYDADKFCGCTFDLLEMVKGAYWYENQETVDRILKTGYNQQETDAIAPCMDTAKI